MTASPRLIPKKMTTAAINAKMKIPTKESRRRLPEPKPLDLNA